MISESRRLRATTLVLPSSTMVMGPIARYSEPLPFKDQERSEQANALLLGDAEAENE